MNLSNDRKSCYFVVVVDKDFNLKYIPKSFLGYDLNLSSFNWIVFNDGEVIKRDDNINKIIQEIKSLNNLLKEKNKPVKERLQNSRKRRKTRNLWKKAHKDLKKAVAPIVDHILQKAITTSSVLCLDSVKTGNENGTFAQEYITSCALSRCQNEGIPHYVIPTPYTTITCNECGFCSKKNKLNSDEFKCLRCGNKCVTHFNASKNIADEGKRLFKKSLLLVIIQK